MQRQTTIAKAQDIERKWFVIDATDLPLGRLASEIAVRLTGKNKPIYTPNIEKHCSSFFFFFSYLMKQQFCLRCCFF